MYSDQMISAMTANGSLVGYAVELLLPAGPFRVHSGVGDLIIEGHTYTGTGDLGAVGMVTQEGDNNPVDVSVSVSGLPTSGLPIALAANVRGSDARVIVIVFDNDTGVINLAEDGFNGFITNYNVVVGDDNLLTCTISDEFTRFEKPIHDYWTDENHQLLEPGDRICRFVSQMSEREISWGGKSDGGSLEFYQ